MSGNPLDDFTRMATKIFGHEGVKGYYQRLESGFGPSATQCSACGHIAFPPRAHCPTCFSDQTEWVPLPETGELYAFTTNSRGLRFAAPSVVGVVELPDVGLVLGPIEGSMKDLSIGQTVRIEVIEVCEGLHFHRFVPA